MLLRRWAALTLVLITLASCSEDRPPTDTPAASNPVLKEESEAAPTKPAVKPAESQTVPETESGLFGTLISTVAGNNDPLQQTEVRVAKVYWNDSRTEGAFVVDESADPVAISDEEGGFSFKALTPRDYVIIVGDLYGNNLVIADQNGDAVIYTTRPGEMLNVGELLVDLASAPSFPTPTSQAYPQPFTTPTPYIYP
ncbi:MAG: hypothetical protein ACK2T3_12405 [Candidatus Promineifilaceae bacterium]